MTQLTIDGARLARAEAKGTAVGPRPLADGVRGDDKAMLRAAADLTRDLNTPKPPVYWADLLGSALVGYAALAGAMLLQPAGAALLCGVLAVLALYRAGSFIHEVTHIKHRALPGFRTAWNLLVGIPLLAPSFLYEGVHNLHHAKSRYGTVEDPEYLPLALMKPWTLPVFLLVSVLAPVALLIRFAVLAPLSLLSTRLRDIVVARYSGLQINPHFRRRPPEGEIKAQWRWQEIAASLWAIGFIALVAGSMLPLRDAIILLVVVSGVMLLNQVRTLVAHLWENDGEPMTVTAQYLDSVNVPPPATLPALWAPVGLRYHALHHLLPGVPYHNLGEAHRRISGALDERSSFHATNHRSLAGLVGRLAASTMRR
ncbi:fatty acid desaturase family protein [Sphingomonas sp. GCM10030256]|uniref:fatty acid desaturase family protein n=1 Tax=Sphingomonas sp. GCM10030256 TaxID=3273427 RepID=UPI0036073BD1